MNLQREMAQLHRSSHRDVPIFDAIDQSLRFPILNELKNRRNVFAARRSAKRLPTRDSMEFNPHSKVVKLCLQGMTMEEKGESEAAAKLFLQAWSEATHDLDVFISTHHLARAQTTAAARIKWLETNLQVATKINSDAVKSAFRPLYSSLAQAYDSVGDHEKAREYRALGDAFDDTPTDKGPFYHGTKADLKPEDLLTAGRNSNYKSELVMNHIYFTALPNGAGLAAALAKGSGRERVYRVEPTGPFEDDPNVTNKKFPGNVTRSYRSTAPLRIVGEATEWVRQSAAELQGWRDKAASSTARIIN